MKIETFEDIIAWQKAKILTLKIFDVAKNCKDYTLKDLLQQESIAVMNNLAEGFDRRITKDMRDYFLRAKASCAHVRSMLYLMLELAYISPELHKELHEMTWGITLTVAAFLKSTKPKTETSEKGTPVSEGK